jgi:hypothetical protein
VVSLKNKLKMIKNYEGGKSVMVIALQSGEDIAGPGHPGKSGRTYLKNNSSKKCWECDTSSRVLVYLFRKLETLSSKLQYHQKRHTLPVDYKKNNKAWMTQLLF